MKYNTLITISAAALCTTAFGGSIVVDGTLDAGYGTANIIQNTQTGYGDSTIGLPDFANGSELDSGHVIIEGDTLHIMLTGNLESTFNKIDIFVDARSGGQNRLRNDNPDIDNDGLNRMGDDGSGKNGLMFDEGFEADYWVSLTCGGDVFATYVDAAQLLTEGGGFGAFVGTGSSGLDGVILGQNGMQIALDNSNTGGVGYGEGLGCGEGVTTGIELSIPLELFDWDGKAGTITTAKVCAFVNNSAHEYMSNQVLGGLGGSPNLGDPRYVNFSKIAGTQYFEVGGHGDPCPEPTGACCVDTDCNDLTSDGCFVLGGDYHGDGTFCNGNPPPCAPKPCQGDTNGDGQVNVEDILDVISNWGCSQ